LDSFLVEQRDSHALAAAMAPASPAETLKWISPFTDKHREIVLADGNPAFSKRMVEPFFQSEGQGLRQHVGLMTSSDKELIVRIQLGQLASIGEMEPRPHAEDVKPDEHLHLVHDHEAHETGKEEAMDRSFGAFRASVHHSRASVDVTSSDAVEDEPRDALPAGLLEADDDPLPEMPR